MSNENLLNQISNAIGAHGSWKLNLRIAVKKGRSDHGVKDVPCDDKCAFGEWLHGPDIDESTRSGAPFNVIKRLHAELHVCAAEVLEKATTGNIPGANALLEGDFAFRSEKLIRGLHKWKGEAAAD